MADNVRFAVFSVKQTRSGERRDSKWIRAGTAWRNRDGSLNVHLDVLPLDGVLHLREEGATAELPLELPPAPTKTA